jgi:N-formylglutamate deformylase
VSGPSFEVLAPSVPPVPVLVHVPHSGTQVPPDLRPAFLLSDAELAEELRRMTDHRTNLLAGGVGALGATRFVNRWSRLVVDPERFTDPAQEEMEAVGMGAVYTATSDRRPLRRLTDAERSALLDRHFHPYHAAFTRLVDHDLARAGTCAIVDLHSYPSTPLPYELHAEGQRPELCIGTHPVHTPRWLRELVVAVAHRHGLRSGFDSPFRGTFVPTPHLGDPRVRSVMLEIRRDTYLDEATGRPHGGEQRLQQLCTEVVAAIAARLDATAS